MSCNKETCRFDVSRCLDSSYRYVSCIFEQEGFASDRILEAEEGAFLEEPSRNETKKMHLRSRYPCMANTGACGKIAGPTTVKDASDVIDNSFPDFGGKPGGEVILFPR